MAAEYRTTPLRKLGNALGAPAARLGFAGRRTYVLTTFGRKSGRRYSTPVQLVLEDGTRWLVAPYGERGWVENARSAGEVELTRSLRTERVRVEEVGPQEAAPVLREYLRRTRIVNAYFDAGKDAPVDEFEGEAPRHPVFRIVA